MKYPLLYHNGKRPNNSVLSLKIELMSYLKEEHSKGHLPGKRELQNRFNMRLDSPIEELYISAGLNYRLPANQNIKAIKAKLLLDLIVKNLAMFNLELLKYRAVHERGIDIVAKRGSKIVGIELKAYNQFEPLKNKDVEQVKRFIEKEKLDYAILITTANLENITIRLSDNIRIIKYPTLRKIFTNLEDIRSLQFIRAHSTNQEDSSKAVKRQQILDYVLSECKKGHKPSCIDIANAMHTDIRTCFDGLFEIYKILKIPPPIKNMGGLRAKTPDTESISLWKEEFKRFILEEINCGRKYPSGVDIAKHFGISHVWNIVKVSELYAELGLKSYRERGKGSRISTSVPDV